MEKVLLEEIKAKLINQREEIREQLKSFAKEDSSKEDDFKTEFPKFGDKEDDNATEVATFHDNLSLERNLETTLSEINQALKNIAEGKYGICQNCHKEIEEERLKVMPTATTCLKCK